MQEETAFLNALPADPTDDATRLIYADWLEERGDARADFIRTVVNMKGFPLGDVRRVPRQVQFLVDVARMTPAHKEWVMQVFPAYSPNPQEPAQQCWSLLHPDMRLPDAAPGSLTHATQNLGVIAARMLRDDRVKMASYFLPISLEEMYMGEWHTQSRNDMYRQHLISPAHHQLYLNYDYPPNQLNVTIDPERFHIIPPEHPTQVKILTVNPIKESLRYLEQQIVNMAQEMPTLRPTYLNLSHCNYMRSLLSNLLQSGMLDDTVALNLTSASSSMHALNANSLGYVTADDLSLLLTHPRCSKNLRILQMRNCYLIDDHLHVLGKSPMPNLALLDCSSTMPIPEPCVAPDALGNFADTAQMPALRFIWLPEKMQSRMDESMMHRFAGAKNLPSLQIIRCGDHVFDIGAERIRLYQEQKLVCEQTASLDEFNALPKDEQQARATAVIKEYFAAREYKAPAP